MINCFNWSNASARLAFVCSSRKRAKAWSKRAKNQFRSKIFRRKIGRRLLQEAAFRAGFVQRRAVLSAAPFRGSFVIALIGQEVNDRRQEKGTELSSRAVARRPNSFP